MLGQWGVRTSSHLFCLLRSASCFLALSNKTVCAKYNSWHFFTKQESFHKFFSAPMNIFNVSSLLSFCVSRQLSDCRWKKNKRHITLRSHFELSHRFSLCDEACLKVDAISKVVFYKYCSKPKKHPWIISRVYQQKPREEGKLAAGWAGNRGTDSQKWSQRAAREMQVYPTESREFTRGW